MKRLYVATVTAVAMFFSVQATTAQVYEESNGNDPQMQTQQQDEFQQVEVQQVPMEIHQAVQDEYQGAQISEAYLKEKDGETKYRLVLQTEDGQSKEVYSDAEGNLKDKDEKDHSKK